MGEITATVSDGVTDVEKVINVTVGAAPSIDSFHANDSTVVSGSSVTLSWAATGTGPITYTLDGVVVSGTSATVIPTADTTYTLIAESSFGSDTATVTVDVGLAPVITSFTADDYSVPSGTQVNFSWSVTGATSLDFEGQDVSALTGVAVFPSITTTYTLTATNQYGSMTSTVDITVEAVFAVRDSSVEIDLDGATSDALDSPWGVWANATTIWVVHNDGFSNPTHRLFAFNRATLARDSAKGFNLNNISDPTGVWSDGTRFWIVDYFARVAKAVSYSGTRQASHDITFDANQNQNRSPVDIWSDGTYMYVLNEGGGGHLGPKRVFCYRMSDSLRVNSREFDMHSDNGRPLAFWSDGTTLWVTDNSDDKVYAYVLATGVRDASKDFDLEDPPNGYPNGCWGDAGHLFIADAHDDHLYAYSWSI